MSRDGPDPAGAAYSAPPDLAGFRGPTSKGKGEEEGQREEGKGKGRKEGEGDGQGWSTHPRF